MANNKDGTNYKIQVKNVTHIYLDKRLGKHVKALNEVNLNICKNEFITVLGPSGCGKSTLLKLIAGLIKPSSGEILLDGKVIKGPGPDRGVVFQEYALFPWKNVEQNIEFGLRMKGMPKHERQKKVEQVLKLVGLVHFKDKFPHELSGGMKQRVAVARVIANEPEVMLMDEPFAAVDAQTRLTLQDEMARIFQETKNSIFFVTHSVDEAVFLGDRVAIMTANGQIKEIVPIDIDRRERNWNSLGKNRYFEEVKKYALESVLAEGAKKRELSA
jgi:NitT/TauT family transport system ATP-binding protein